MPLAPPVVAFAEDPNYRNDTGSNFTNMQSQVMAYQASMDALIETVRSAARGQSCWHKDAGAQGARACPCCPQVIPLGGFYWQLMDGGGAKLNTAINNTTDPATCKVEETRLLRVLGSRLLMRRLCSPTLRRSAS